MRDEYQRLAFAELLERLSRDVGGPGEWNDLVVEWNDLVVNHYLDEELEEIRRQVVRLAIERDPGGRPVWRDSDRDLIRSWARQLLDVGTA